ncbi:MerR family transcriptional regulator [Fontibacillus phaseoli]|uniref:MerR family transcriptional regulator n=1 Tax=Fontibacillus phaseoli TaxID=1416533 RepID=A0A369AUB6_9BACL|nr:MerR family transcriptional regulator [Fontibacillus phaseoli]RCX12801.1 MerR family transcriptional regulator [Fontibacillus phaseoli]
MKYCIGEFSSILGITRDTLRLYEKHDIVKPVKDDLNSYRYFNDLDARDLLMSRWYRSMHIPLQEVAELMKQSSPEGIAEKMGTSCENLDMEIRKNTMLLNKMKELHRELEMLEASLYQCIYKKRPGLYRLKQTQKNRLLKNDDLKGIVNTWMEWLPFVFYCFRIEKGELATEEKNTWDYSWGLTLTVEDAQRLEVEIDSQVEYMAPADCISAVIKVSHRENITKRTLQFMFDDLQANGYAIQGDIVGRILLNEKRDGQTWSYLEVDISV